MENNSIVRAFDSIDCSEEELYPINSDPEVGPSPILDRCMELHYDLSRAPINGPLQYVLSVSPTSWAHSVSAGFLGDIILHLTVIGLRPFTSDGPICPIEKEQLQAMITEVSRDMDLDELDKMRNIFEFVMDRAADLQSDVVQTEAGALAVDNVLDRRYKSQTKVGNMFELVSDVFRQAEECLDSLGVCYSEYIMKRFLDDEPVFRKYLPVSSRV